MTGDLGTLIVGVAALVVFAVTFHLSGLLVRVRTTIGVARQSLAIIGENSLDDKEKELLAQRAALRLFAQFALITMTAIVVLAMPGVVMLVGDLMEIASFDVVSSFLLSWEVIIGATIFILAAVLLVRHH